MSTPFLDDTRRQREVDWLLWFSTLVLVLLAFAARVYRIFDLPPGLTGDEAYNLMDVRRILEGGYHPLYFEGNNGREPLFIYMQAPLVALLGPVPYALRLTSALVGTLTVALTYRWIKDLFGRWEDPVGRWLPAVTSFLLASSLWHVNQSRIGLRVISLPLLAVLTFILFWRGYVAGKRSYFLAAGASLGLSLYTYSAARLLPLLLILFLLGRRVWSRVTAKGTVGGMALMAAGLALMAAPLSIYALTHPRLFWDRALEVSALNVNSPPVGDTVARTLGMFLWKGGPAFFFNLGGRPIFDFPMGLMFYFGLGISIAVLWSRRGGRVGPNGLSPIGPEACLFSILWLIIMLGPSLFSSPSPHFLRALGAAPAVYIFPALAIAVLARRLYSVRWRRLGVLILVLVTLGSGFDDLWSYFRLTSANSAYYAFAGDMLNIGIYIKKRSQTDYVYGDKPLMADNTVSALTLETSAASFDSRWAIVFPPGPVEYLLLTSDDPLRSFGRYLPPDAESFVWRDGQGKGVLVGYRTDGRSALAYNRTAPASPLYGAHQPPTEPGQRETTIAGEISLRGYGVAPRDVSESSQKASIRPGQPFRVILAWEAVRHPSQSYQVSVKAFDRMGKAWAQSDASPGQNSYPTTRWRPGEWIYDFYELTLEPGAPAGLYYLEVTVYDLATLRILPVLSADRQPLSQHYILGDIQVDG